MGNEPRKFKVLSKSKWDDEPPTWYETDEKQLRLFKIYKKPITKYFPFGKMKIIASCDYEIISEIRKTKSPQE